LFYIPFGDFFPKGNKTLKKTKGSNWFTSSLRTFSSLLPLVPEGKQKEEGLTCGKKKGYNRGYS
jgi:hypothetical protein